MATNLNKTAAFSPNVIYDGFEQTVTAVVLSPISSNLPNVSDLLAYVFATTKTIRNLRKDLELIYFLFDFVLNGE